MKLKGKSQVLRIYIGSMDKYNHTPMYEVIINEAKKFGMAGASAFRGILSFGANSTIHSAKIWTLSADLPIVIEIVDEKNKIEAFTDYILNFFEDKNFGGLISTYEVEVIHYIPHQKEK